jgi:hypothetical protein
MVILVYVRLVFLALGGPLSELTDASTPLDPPVLPPEPPLPDAPVVEPPAPEPVVPPEPVAVALVDAAVVSTVPDVLAEPVAPPEPVELLDVDGELVPVLVAAELVESPPAPAFCAGS